ncbi:hypothetical protein D3P08_05100 [Paenibacillus nanensis]|uniref:Glycoside hydrolase family 42 N-terminal domain-containing protein n=1 Tax=Paenibacillus nanensis TaxID=393251 RepID=A0A3A1VLY8_9BACL|nr:beta-galactosidase [Paenibacillus nanensis]RIX59523.1 hypothetical protein D3P08_05100 [Paenibacillus nanensis]
MEDDHLPVRSFRLLKNTQVNVQDENALAIETSALGGGVYVEASDIPGGLWRDDRYLTVDIYHESHDVLVVLLSFTDEENRTITVHYGVLPRALTRLCLPLSALNGEKLFLDRYPGVMQAVLRGDAFVDRCSIKRFEVSTIPSVSARMFELSGMTLRSSPPAFSYDPTAYIDELGQLAWKEWPGKTKDEDELVCALQDEWRLSQQQEVSSAELGRYGGWRRLRYKATGYFRTEYDGQNWWFVDPEGYALFSAGMDCIHPSGSMRVSGMEHLTPPLPPKEGKFGEAWTNEGFSHGVANLIRAFGADWRAKWQALTERRLKGWGINTIGNWSAADFIAGSELPYVYPMRDFPSTEHRIFRDFPDVFSPEYERQAEAFARQLVPMKDDARMIGYFMRNEPHWAFVDGLDLTEQMLRSPHRFASKSHFVQWLYAKYKSVDQWNAAWGTSFNSFDDLYEPELIACWPESESRSEDFAIFNRMMIRRYVELPARFCKYADPHHLNLGMRYAWVGSDAVLEGCEAFDVFSINCYAMEPNREQIRSISERLNMPVMIGEFHFGAADAGMLAYGIRAVATQADRGLAYQYFVEQAAAIPELIGVHYFQWNDQPVLGRFDGENYQIGVVDVCHRPYQPFIEAMKRTHERMYEIRSGKASPLSQGPKEIPKTGF